MTCESLQDDSESVEDQSRAAELQPGLGEDLSGCELEFTEDPSTQVPPRPSSSGPHKS
jgi:hypothetical protein